jgi:hypothetical protein
MRFAELGLCLIAVGFLPSACTANDAGPGDETNGGMTESAGSDTGGSATTGGSSGGGTAGNADGTGGKVGAGAGLGGSENGGSRAIGGTAGIASGGVQPSAATAGAVVPAFGGSSGAGGAAKAGAAGDAGSAGRGEGGEGGAGDTPDRVVLFDGASFGEWQRLAGGNVTWELPGDGTMVVRPGDGNIVTRRTFGDLFVHVEYKTPRLASNVTGQNRGNSGVYLNSMYELQVLDSFGLSPAIDGCGAIYKVSAPSSTACHDQEIWNIYEIEFQVARFDGQNRKQSPARVISAHLNGVLVQQNVDVPGSTEAGEPESPGPGPLMLQDHSNRVAFRNIWAIPR